MGKIIGWTIAAVVLYYAWKVSQDTGAMLFAAGLFVGVLCIGVGVALAVVMVRAMQHRAPRETAAPQGQIIDGWHAMPQLQKPGATMPAFQDAQTVHLLDEVDR